jgi:hypothetical protein
MHPTVSRDDAKLIQCAHGLFNYTWTPPHSEQDVSSRGRPILEDTIRKGVARFLLRGGWESREGLDGTTGRIWERYPPPDIRISGYVYELLRTPRNSRALSREPQTIGDEIVAWLAIRGMQRGEYDIASEMRRIRANGSHLIALAFPDAGVNPPGLDEWVAENHVVLSAVQRRLKDDVVAGFQRVLTRKWPDIRAGAAHREMFLAVCDSLGRYDLAMFLQDAVPELIDLDWDAISAMEPRSGATFTEGQDVIDAVLQPLMIPDVVATWRREQGAVRRGTPRYPAARRALRALTTTHEQASACSAIVQEHRVAREI